MRWWPPILLLALSIAPAAAQGVVVGERVETGDTGPVGYRELYGDPLDASLESLSTFLAGMNFRAVRTQGRLERTREGDWYKLSDGLYSLLLVPVEEIDPHDLMRFAGTRVEVVGLARELPERQRQNDCQIRGYGAPETKCREWNLPPLPDRLGRADWPTNSITFWAFSDATPFERRRRGEGGLQIGDVIAEPGRFEGEKVVLTGRFRGANLFGDLPVETRGKASDWVIETDGAAIWVTGKEPRGRGWKLDPTSKSDGRWWIRVTGKIEARDGVARLEADGLELRRGPE